MGERGGEPLIRAEARWQRATLLELLFDLVFVFALNQVSLRLIDDFTSGGVLLFDEGAATLLLFLVVWTLWMTTVSLTSRVQPDALPVQAAVFSAMAGAVVMAVAINRGFEEHALVFAGAYVAARLSRVPLILAMSGIPATQRFPRPLVLAVFASAVPWIAGALVGAPLPRGLLWAFALVVDWVGFAISWRQAARESIAGEHLAERLQQFVLIALGEAIFVAGRAFSGSDFTFPHAVGFGLAIVTTVLFWRIYLYRAGLTLPLAITTARNRARQAVGATTNHLLMIGGVVLAGVGFELYIAGPLDRGHPQWLIAILGGPALFLLGRAPFEFQVFGRVSRSRLAGLLALGLLVPVTWFLLPLGGGAGAAVVLAAIAVSDAWRAHGREPEAPAPPI